MTRIAALRNDRSLRNQSGSENSVDEVRIVRRPMTSSRKAEDGTTILLAPSRTTTDSGPRSMIDPIGRPSGSYTFAPTTSIRETSSTSLLVERPETVTRGGSEGRNPAWDVPRTDHAINANDAITDVLPLRVDRERSSASERVLDNTLRGCHNTPSRGRER